MRRARTRITWALAFAAMLAVTAVEAQPRGTLQTTGRLREQADQEARILATVAKGAVVTVLAEDRGWLRVRLPDGTTGWLWAANVRLERGAQRDEAPASTAPAPATLATPVPAAGPTSDELRAVRAEIETLRQRQPGASTADLERLRSEVRALAAAQRDLERRLHLDVPATVPIDVVTEGAAGESTSVPGGGGGVGAVAAVLVLAGGAIGWIGSRLALRRRERRQRVRL